jgi:hypothetical protein
MHADIWLYCSVRVTPYKRTTLTTPFLLLSPSDLHGRINLYVNLAGSTPSSSSGAAAELSVRKPYQRRTSPSVPMEIKLPDMSELNLPAISEDEDMVG